MKIQPVLLGLGMGWIIFEYIVKENKTQKVYT